jgi:predicted negative regulator of RcsB-dependent stress response
MAAYDLEEQEQLEELKTWWKLHGNLVTTVITVVALAVAGWQGWNWWQRQQSVKASAVYMALEQTIGSRDAKKSRELAGELIEKYPGTAYAAMGALLSAHAQVEFGDAKTAHVQLQWVADSGKDDVMRDLARLRLAALLLDEKAYDDALKQLMEPPQAALAPRFAELKGDVLVAQGKKSDAAKSYATALDAVDEMQKIEGRTQNSPGSPHEPYRNMLQAKLDSLGVQGAAK